VILQNCMCVEECACDLAELSVCGQCASDVAELPVPVIWQNCLSVDSVPVIWQNCLFVEEYASGLEKISCASDLAELSVCG